MFETKIFDQELLTLEQQVELLEGGPFDRSSATPSESREKLLVARLHERLHRDYARNALTTHEFIGLSRRVLKLAKFH